MKPAIYMLLVFSLSGILNVNSFSSKKTNVKQNTNKNSIVAVAQNDTFSLGINTGKIELNGNVLTNDSESFNNGMRAALVEFPRSGKLVFKSNGSFTFENTDCYEGEITFRYKASLIQKPEQTSEATVLIVAGNDNDFDDVIDIFDLDNDNDGLLNIHEGLTIDSDNDGIFNCFDIDSDNDGIPDNVEWQTENNYITLSGIDANKNGWDDAYEPMMGGNYYNMVDTDLDGTPDFLDTDSDNDRILDVTESSDFNLDNKPDLVVCNVDCDKDGLDDSFDNVHGWINKNNSTGTKSVLADADKNGIRDWRDDNKMHTPGIEDFISTENELFTIFPNPSNGIFRIRFVDENEDNLFNSVIIHNIKGEKVISNHNIGFNQLVDASHLQKGMYFVQIRCKNRTYSHKLIIR